MIGLTSIVLTPTERETARRDTGKRKRFIVDKRDNKGGSLRLLFGLLCLNEAETSFCCLWVHSFLYVITSESMEIHMTPRRDVMGSAYRS